MVVPRELVEAFRTMKEDLNLRSPTIEQRAMAIMIRAGDYERHIYRMSKIYRRKRAVLAESLEEYFGGMVDVFGDEAGMHLLAKFNPRANMEGKRSFGIWRTDSKYR